MRTTIELSDDRRAKLLQIAAERGEKGFSRIIEEALDHYFEERERRRERVEAALGVLGSLDPERADRLEESVRRLRERWR